jgi:hypothetical protein
MVDQLYYVYAFTCADCPLDSLGSGVDDRYNVELVPCGRVAALTSLVGLDQFDLKKLQSDSADLDWISRVALRHNEIVAETARRRPVLPLRMGALFRSITSLLTKLDQYQAAVDDFLQELGDRREWAAKIYLDLQDNAENPEISSPAIAENSKQSGVNYLLRRRQQTEIRRKAQTDSKQQIAVVEAALGSHADRYCRLHILPTALTRRREKMLWNAAFLVSTAAQKTWLETVEPWRTVLLERGLLLEVTGPWPAYHFCPEIAALQKES